MCSGLAKRGGEIMQRFKLRSVWNVESDMDDYVAKLRAEGYVANGSWLKI